MGGVPRPFHTYVEIRSNAILSKVRDSIVRIVGDIIAADLVDPVGFQKDDSNVITALQKGVEREIMKPVNVPDYVLRNYVTMVLSDA